MEETLKRIDHLIKSGDGDQARKSLSELKVSTCERQHRARVAQLARRLGLVHLGLNFMRPIVRPKTPITPPANDEELSVYASLLIKIRAFREALEILKSLDPDNTPEILLYQSYGLMAQWEYPKTIPLLKKYIKSNSVSEYQRLIGKVNLSSAYLCTNDQNEFLTLAEEIKTICQKNNHALLYGVTLEHMAQYHIHKKEYTQAEEILKLSQNNLKNAGGYHLFFVKKWQSIISFLKNPHQLESIHLLNEVRKKSIEIRHWETLRECDYFEALALQNVNLYHKVYFGTPHVQYRKRMKELTSFKVELPTHYDFNFTDSKAQLLLDVPSGRFVSGDSVFKQGQQPLKLLQLFSKDFYRPLREGDIFNELYKGQYFDPQTTPQRVFRSVQKLNQHFKSKNIPLNISRESGEFHLKNHLDFALRVNLSSNSLSKNEYYLVKIKEHFSKKSFSKKEVSLTLNTPDRSTSRFLKWAIENKKIQSTGQGRNRRYLL